jgi:hypothetical protein
MRAESVALIPRCVECEACWLPADEERWFAYLTNDEPPKLAFFCPECSEAEFGEGLAADRREPAASDRPFPLETPNRRAG